MLTHTPHLCELLHFTPYMSLCFRQHLSYAAPYMCTQICSYILGRWQNFTPNTKYISPHSSPVGRPFYYRAAGRTLLSIIRAAFVRYEYEEQGLSSSPLVSSRLCERALPSKRLHLPVIVEPCVWPLVDVKVFRALQRAINTSKAGPNVSVTEPAH